MSVPSFVTTVSLDTAYWLGQRAFAQEPAVRERTLRLTALGGKKFAATIPAARTEKPCFKGFSIAGAGFEPATSGL